MNQDFDQSNEDSVIAEIIGLDWAADDAIEVGLLPEHFQCPVNAGIFLVAKSQRERGLPVNTADIAEGLRIAGFPRPMIESCGARLDLVRLETKTGVSVAHYARKVILAWRSRQHRISVNAMLRDIAHGADWLEAEGRHQSRIAGLTAGSSNIMKTFGDSVLDLVAETEGRRSRGLQTGFRDLDEATGGLRPGNLVLLAGGTGGGKSALGLCVGLNVAEHGGRVLIVSGEMSVSELHERAASVFSSINPYFVRGQRLSKSQRQLWVDAVQRAARLPIAVIDNNRHLNSLVSSIRASHRRQPLSLLIVDYAQLIQASGHNREREVAQVSATFKALAADLSIPAIVMAQLNRGPDAREDKRPRLSDLRESSSLAHDSDLVLMIHRPDEHNPDDRPGEVELLIRKGRSVDKGVVRLLFRKEFTRFENYAPTANADYRFASVASVHR